MCVWFNWINIHRKIRYCNQLWVNPKSSAARLEFHQLPNPYPWLCALEFQFESNPKLKDRASSSAGNWLGMGDTWGHLSCCTLHEEYWMGVTLNTIQCNQYVQCVLIATRTLRIISETRPFGTLLCSFLGHSAVVFFFGDSLSWTLALASTPDTNCIALPKDFW